MKKLLVLLALLCAPALADTTYYPSGNPVRQNGMDLDRDFTLGEVGVDDLACDEQGETETSNISTENLDGSIDATVERQIYVDLDSGVDDTSCGVPSDACGTIDYAVATRGTATTASGDNLFICVQGTTTTRIPFDADYDGESGTVTLTAAGRSNSNQKYDHTMSENPTVIMAWDTDNDNEYHDNKWHYDTTGNAFVCNANACPRDVEVAHFESNNTGTSSSTTGKYVVMNAGTLRAGGGERWYLHDFEALNHNFDKCQHSDNIFFSLFSNQFTNFQMRRGYVNRVHNYGWRGNYVGGGGSGPHNLLFSEMYFEWAGIGGATTELDGLGNACSSAGGSEKTGGNLGRMYADASHAGDSNIEIIDSFFGIDTTYGTNGYREGIATNGEIVGGIKLAGLREVNLSGNMVRDIKGFFTINTDDGNLNAQTTIGHYHDNNTFIASHATPFFDTIWGVMGVSVASSGTGNSRDEMSGTHSWSGNCVDYSNVTSDDTDGFLQFQGTGSSDYTAATWRIENNKVLMDNVGSRGFIWSSPNSSNESAVPGTLIVTGNLFADTGGASTTHNMINFNNVDYTTEWDSGNGNNEYYGVDFHNESTDYASLSAWTTAGFEEASTTAGTNPTVTCNDLSDGTDYAAGGGGPGPSPSTTKYFPFAKGN